MNLLSAPWLPFKLRNGQIEYRPPAAITDDEVIDLAMPRADFQGAAYQWLIGLLQTALGPNDHDDWLDFLEQATNADQLAERFLPLAPAFEFDGDGPRFMQDIDPLDSVKPARISSLLIDAPGGNGIKNNTDLFIKRGRAETLCADCAAIALFTLQINAPAGGVGYRVGLRGGGPLTTLILPDKTDENDESVASLWRKLWLNILPKSVALRGGNGCKTVAADDANLFPWMDDTRTSEKKGSDVFPNSVHPLHAYWAMPRRYRLLFDQQPCVCELCGRETDSGVSEVRAKNYGMNYGGPWQHPLTPYRTDPKKPAEPPLSTKCQPGGVGYQHWSHLVLQDTENGVSLPATVVNDFSNRKYQTVMVERQLGATEEALIHQARLWAFGYDMDNMKPRCWYSVEIPLVAIPPEQQEVLRAWTVQFVELSRQAAWMTRTQVKNAWFSRPKDAKGDMSDIDQQFYEATQSAFFRALRRMGDALVDDKTRVHVPVDIARDWYQDLRTESLQIFDGRALSGPLNELVMKRVIRARRYLSGWWRTGKNGKGEAKKFARWASLYTDASTTDSNKETVHE